MQCNDANKTLTHVQGLSTADLRMLEQMPKSGREGDFGHSAVEIGQANGVFPAGPVSWSVDNGQAETSNMERRAILQQWLQAIAAVTDGASAGEASEVPAEGGEPQRRAVGHFRPDVSRLEDEVDNVPSMNPNATSAAMDGRSAALHALNLDCSQTNGGRSTPYNGIWRTLLLGTVLLRYVW